ncbi:MAG: hypothetical protein J7J77_01395 [Candidatus Cloacimonetes bacterium]|nr:hypothetical protein [Candidatus Cloacimonadota bacterium]
MKKDEKVFRVPPFIRTITIIFALLALVWAIYYITNGISQTDKWFKKLSPFIVLFLVVSVLHKNLFTVNSIHIEDNFLQFRFILKRAIRIDWTAIKKLEFGVKRRNAICLTYEENGVDKQIIIPRGIQEIISALNLIAKRAQNLELDDFMKTVIKNET